MHQNDISPDWKAETKENTRKQPTFPEKHPSLKGNAARMMRLKHQRFTNTQNADGSIL